MTQVASASEAGVRSWDVRSSDRRQAPFPGGPTVRVVVGPAESAGVGVLEVTMPVGGAMPEHDHGPSAVLLSPLAGRFRLVEADEPGREIELEPGVVATIPVGLRVRLENAGTVEARTLVVLTPPDFAEQLEAWPASRTPASR